ncbi:hypothetical protein EYF80_033707 [Liparis tanakae]|uniref:Uncharacterized protein n=1 Tax=Liparis tanakae TaxID=230148 RepID=A0A4Z2GRH2_9TELE|nr:hypothetical protein EYF80_033707 [Liparis tanakae]
MKNLPSPKPERDGGHKNREKEDKRQSRGSCYLSEDDARGEAGDTNHTGAAFRGPLRNAAGFFPVHGRAALEIRCRLSHREASAASEGERGDDSHTPPGLISGGPRPLE